jgi:hypothetical protein
LIPPRRAKPPANSRSVEKFELLINKSKPEADATIRMHLSDFLYSTLPRVPQVAGGDNIKNTLESWTEECLLRRKMYLMWQLYNLQL